MEVEAPALAEVHASGAVTLEADVGRTPWLGASASGAARLTLWGFAEQKEVELSGASSYDALELGSREAWLTVSGASQAWVRVTRMLDVDASGASHVWFRGHPAVYARVSGASTVSEY